MAAHPAVAPQRRAQDWVSAAHAVACQALAQSPAALGVAPVGTPTPLSAFVQGQRDQANWKLFLYTCKSNSFQDMIVHDLVSVPGYLLSCKLCRSGENDLSPAHRRQLEN